MFVASLIHARAVSVLLGGSGVGQPQPGAYRDVGALLSPRKAQTNRDAAGSISVESDDALRQAAGHD